MIEAEAYDYAVELLGTAENEPTPVRISAARGHLLDCAVEVLGLGGIGDSVMVLRGRDVPKEALDALRAELDNDGRPDVPVLAMGPDYSVAVEDLDATIAHLQKARAEARPR